MTSKRLQARGIFVAALMVSSITHAEWQEATSRHFVVYSDDSAEHVRQYSERLERYDSAVRALRVMQDRPVGSAGRVTVYVLDSVSDVQALRSDRSLAGFYMPRAAGSSAFSARTSATSLSSNEVLLHEYAHHLMWTNWSDVTFPAWFMEGFAEFHATALFRPNGAVTFGRNPDYRTYSINTANNLPLAQLLQPSIGKATDWKRAALYARGWLLTHYLTFDASRRKQLADYLVALNAGKPVEEAAKAFGALSDHELDNYAKRSTLPSITIEPAQIRVGEVTLRALTPAEAAIMPARIWSQAGVDKKSAPKAMELARKLAAPFPGEPHVQRALAEAEFDAGNFELAEAAADRALAADPKFLEALDYKGMAQMAVAKKEKVTDAPAWAAIRKTFLTANRLDPENPAPLILFYQSFGAAGQAATKNAQNGLLYAYALAPHDLNLRYMAGRVFLEQDQAKLARVALAPVAYSPDSGVGGERVAKALEGLDQNGAAATLAALTAAELPDESDGK
jgi:tetratricopeptide (TPR) repeat protein